MISPAHPIGFFAYACAAATFVVLALLLQVAAGSSARGRWLIMVVTLNALWAAQVATDAYVGLPGMLVFWGEFVRASAWILLLMQMGRSVIGRFLPTVMLTGLCIVALVGGLVHVGVWPDSVRANKLLSLIGMTLALMVLVLIEQIYRNSSTQTRWSFRFLVIGLGGVYAFDLSMYAEASMLKMLDAGVWQARGFVNALLMPLVLITARRNPEWQFDVFVSRQVTFYTGVILAVGVYVLMMAGGGYLASSVGGHWGSVLQAVFLAVAAAFLTLMVFSTNIRRRARIFLSKHFYRNQFDYRVEWLRFVKTLAVAESESFGPTMVRAVAQIFASPGGMLFVASRDGRFLIPHAVWPAPSVSFGEAEQLDCNGALSRYLLETRWVIDLQEYSKKPGQYDNVQIPGFLSSVSGVRLIAPLILSDRLIGLLALESPPAPFELGYEDRDLLKTVCQHVATHVAQYLADQRLAEANQFQAHGKLAAFMMHDLKNSVAQLQLVVENSKRHKHDPEFFDDVISTTENVVDRINRLVLQLRDQGESTKTIVDLGKLLKSMFAQPVGAGPYVQVERCDEGCLVFCDPTRVAAAVEHAIRNAQEATPESRSVSLRLVGGADSVRVEITDKGCGMTAQFVRERLFRPFDSTKGVKGMGIGAYQAREYAREINGDVEVTTAPGSGTTFCIILPRCPAVE